MITTTATAWHSTNRRDDYYVTHGHSILHWT